MNRPLPRYRMAKLKRDLPKNFKLVGKRVYLRPILTSDVNRNYWKWLNDPEVIQYTESRYLKNTLPGLKKYVTAAIQSPSNFFFAIIEKSSRRHIGNIKIESTVNPFWDHLVAEVGILIGEKGCWGKGYGTEAISLISDFSFKKLNLHKLTGTCFASNKGAARAFLLAGFEEEAIRPSNARFKGKYIGLQLFGTINPKHKK